MADDAHRAGPPARTADEVVPAKIFFLTARFGSRERLAARLGISAQLLDDALHGRPGARAEVVMRLFERAARRESR